MSNINLQNRLRYIRLIMIILVFVGFQIKVQTTYAQIPVSVCSDRPTNELSTIPTTVWVEINTYWNEWPNKTEPFAQSFTFDEYVAGVMLGELGSSPDNIANANLPSNNGIWEESALEAMAVSIRTYSWFRLNYAEQFPDPHIIAASLASDKTAHCGFWDEKMVGGRQVNAQIFRPFYRNITQVTKDRFKAIITQHVPNIYLVSGEGTKPIDAEYRATVGEYSDAEGKPYLATVFNPISTGDGNPTKAFGLGQWGSQRWAMGLDDDNIDFPRWQDYQQILFHYYTGVNLRTANNGNILTPTYRWNPLILDWGGGAVTPPDMLVVHTTLISNYKIGVHFFNLYDILK